MTGTLLAGLIRETIADVERTVARAEAAMQKAQRTGDDMYLDAAAVNLHTFYTGLEHLFETIAREIDGSLPSGPSWHTDLLRQMAADVPGVRPAVLSRASRDCLEEYRSFRHVVCHIYMFNLHPGRVRLLVSELRACFERVRADLERFAEVIARIDDADQPDGE